MTAQRQPICFIATSKPDAAADFYGPVLGLELLDRSPHALVYNDGGVMLRVQIVPELTPSDHTVHGWKVDDIDAAIRDLSAKGVDFLMFAQMEQSPSGVWTTPNGDRIAWFKDPSDNVLSLTQFARTSE